MTDKPWKPCSYPGCGILTKERYCERHTGLAVTKNWKGGGAEYSREFRAARKKILKGSPACMDCGRIADTVHHADCNRNNNRIENLIPLCRPCHEMRHGRKRKGQMR